MIIEPAFVDYESFWDVGYSLRQAKVSTTDYIHDDRFELHGASCAIGQADPMWKRGHDLEEFIKQAQQDGRVLVGHHMLFDGYVTRYVYKLVMKDYFCTMGLIEALFQGAIGRGLDEAMTSLLGWKTGKTNILNETKGLHWHEFTEKQRREMAHYACEDLRATQELYYQYGPSLPADEHRIMSLILRMFCNPQLEFDSELLLQALASAHQDRDERIELACTYFDIGEDELRGNNSFRDLIESCGMQMPMKASPSDPDKQIPALAKTDQGFIDLLENDDPRVKALAEGRLAVKSTQSITRTQRFIDLDMKVGYLPVAYNYYRAHTGRLSGANKINLANLKSGSDLRKSIVAPKGFRLGVADSEQIECRDVNYLSGNDYMIDLFRRKEDPYNAQAAEIFGRPIDRKKPEDEIEGFIGKTAVLGLGFQMAGPKFKWTAEMGAKVRLGKEIDISLDEAYRIVEIYRSTNYPVPEFWKWLQEALFRMVNNEDPFVWDYGDGELRFVPKENKIYFPNGTYLFYPLLGWADGSFTYVTRLGKNYVNRYIYGGKLCENIVQKHARDIVAWQMLNIAERYEVVMHTYDENIALLPETEADEGLEWMINEMTRTPDWAASIPLGAEGGHAREYSK